MAGVDGFRGRWVVALVSGRDVRLEIAEDARDVLSITSACVAVGVDVPMGLSATGQRRCEPAARVRLGRARSAVFSTPPRGVLEHVGDWPAALAACRRATGGVGLSKQSFHLLPGVKAFDDLRVDESRIVEVHPELSFRVLAPDEDFAGKRTARGQGQRIAALASWVDLAAALADLPVGPAMDDVLDAVAGAWSARRWAAQTHHVLGGELDATGRVMRIVV